MTKPEPIVISLTPEQVDQLKAHFAHVAREASRGAKGMLLGQVWNIGNPYDEHNPVMRVGFLDSEKAIQLYQAAHG